MIQSKALLGLRRALQRATYGHHPRDHLEILEGLRPKFSHQIRLIAPADEVKRYTCVMHALDIADPPPVIVELAKRWDCDHPSPDFLGQLIDEQVLEELGESATTTGDLVVYCSRKTIKHVGFVDDDQVLSKWGIGNLWRHPLLEVPSAYGSSIRRFHGVTRSVVVPAFLAFAREKIGELKVERAIRRTAILRPQ